MDDPIIVESLKKIASIKVHGLAGLIDIPACQSAKLLHIQTIVHVGVEAYSVPLGEDGVKPFGSAICQNTANVP
jgi:hypothetical protein